MNLIEQVRLLPDNWALVPISGDKRPMGMEWEKYPRSKQWIENAFLNGFQVPKKDGTTYFAKPQAVGVICGIPSSGLLFLDHDGASCDELIEKLSEKQLLPKTVGCTSGKPGRFQLIYQVPKMYWNSIQGKRISTGVIGADGKGEQLELRWSGGQGTTMQSVILGKHPETGSYQWLLGRAPWECEIAPVPKWMLEQMLTSRIEQPLFQDWNSFNKSFQLPIADTIPLEICLTKNQKSQINGVSEGGRDNAAIALACGVIGAANYLDTVGQKYHPDPRHLFENFCYGCSPPLAHKDIERIWKSAQGDHPTSSLSPDGIETVIKSWDWKRKKQSVPSVEQVNPKSTQQATYSSAATALLDDLDKRTESIAYWMAKYAEAANLEKASERKFFTALVEKLCPVGKEIAAVYSLQQAEEDEFEPEDLLDFANRDLESRVWIVAKWVASGTVYINFAEGGCGKTLLAYYMAKCVVLGEAFLGARTNKGRVLIIQTDEPSTDTKERVIANGIVSNITNGQIWIERKWTFSKIAALKKWLIKKTFSNQDLIIIDSITSCSRGGSADEKDSKYGDPIYDLRDIADELGCTFWVLHHENKGGANRGSTTLKDNPSEFSRLHKGEKGSNLQQNQRVVTIQKSRSGWFGDHVIEMNTLDYSWKYIKQLGDNYDSTDDALSTRIETHLSLNRHTKLTVRQLAYDLNNDYSQEGLYRECEVLRRLGLIGGTRNVLPSKFAEGGHYVQWLYYFLDASETTFTSEKDDEIINEFDLF